MSYFTTRTEQLLEQCLEKLETIEFRLNQLERFTWKNSKTTHEGKTTNEYKVIQFEDERLHNVLKVNTFSDKKEAFRYYDMYKDYRTVFIMNSKGSEFFNQIMETNPPKDGVWSNSKKSYELIY